MTPVEIQGALRRIELEQDVRVLLAIESGSRAWGFASADSDYDVRFLYVPPPSWYFSVGEMRDVIEAPGPNALDISGWELRKSLRLLAKCNVALNEWLGSPVIYTQVSGFREAMQSLIPSFFNPVSATHHYRGMARSAIDGQQPGAASLKKLMYALRALFACRWIAREASQPPTEFGPIVAAVASPVERRWIDECLKRKETALEQQTFAVDPDRWRAVVEEIQALTLPEDRGITTKDSLHALDAVLKKFASDNLA
jgi:uncharacterized protein